MSSASTPIISQDRLEREARAGFDSVASDMARQCGSASYIHAMADRRFVAGGIAAAVVAGIVLAARSLTSGSSGDVSTPSSLTEEPAAAAPSVTTPTAQGLRCIRGGTSREEVRAILGEPDSIAFGDWLYGASSVTFGYGTVLDYRNAGNLIVCP
jgi:hypothetical protein